MNSIAEGPIVLQSLSLPETSTATVSTTITVIRSVSDVLDFQLPFLNTTAHMKAGILYLISGPNKHISCRFHSQKINMEIMHIITEFALIFADHRYWFFVGCLLVFSVVVVLLIDFEVYLSLQRWASLGNSYAAYTNICRARGITARPKRVKFTPFRDEEQCLAALVAALAAAASQLVFGIQRAVCLTIFLACVHFLSYSLHDQVWETMNERLDHVEAWGIFYGWSQVIEIENALDMHQTASLSDKLKVMKEIWLQLRQENLPPLAAEDSSLDNVD
ncbi:hypothetical protein HDK64DRAFT_321141 [Phyllosticta capitalensis]